MILHKIRLFPFGATVDRRVEFTPHLNVILGPNEAGKSTLVNAIFSVLFFPSNLRRNSNEWKNDLARFIPYPYGDTIRVSLNFICSSQKEYRLIRSWGEEKSDRLFLPDGSEITGEDNLQETLNKVLKYGSGTFAGVFLARQEEMVKTVEMLKQNPEAGNNISDILRAVVLQTGGVSVEELGAKIETEKLSLLSLWDLEKDSPKGGRGIDNPYKQRLGSVISAYYKVEQQKLKIRQTEQLEERVSKLTIKLQEITQEKERIDFRVSKLEEIERDIQQRFTLQPKLDLLREKVKTLKDIISDWPRAEEKVKNIQNQLKQIGEQKELLEQELQEAIEVIRGREKRDLYNRIKPLITEMGNKQEELKNLPAITTEVAKQVQNIEAAISQQKAVLEGMQLKGYIKVTEPMKLYITKGLESAKHMELEKGRDVTFETKGRILLESTDWILEIQSGQMDVSKIMQEIKKDEKILYARLQELSISDVGEAQAILDKRVLLKKHIEQLKLKIDTSLSDCLFVELEKSIASLVPDKHVRDPRAIENDLVNLKMAEQIAATALQTEEGKIEIWNKQYGNFEEAMDEIIALKFTIKGIEDQLVELALLPDEFKTPDEFINCLKDGRAQSRKLQDEIYEVKIELINKQKDLPEESVEELIVELEEAKKQLIKLKSRAKTICIVEAEFNKIIERVDQNTFEPLANSFIKYFSPITNYRYNKVHLEGAVPERVAVTGENGLPVSLLSLGTIRGLSLAIRLAMADYLWRESSGFLILDDPLVDLDPTRKEQAANILKEFAKKRQLLVTTCDPTVAELLGGNIIEY